MSTMTIPVFPTDYVFHIKDYNAALGCDVSRLKTSRLYKLSVTLIYNG
jgi:hypothetical protein